MWTQVAASRSPADVAGLTTPVVGPGGYTLSATQYELTLWIAGSSYDIVFDVAISMIAALRGIATLPQETVGWAYHRDLDPTVSSTAPRTPRCPWPPAKS
jgi:porphyrinogen peroxidase